MNHSKSTLALAVVAVVGLAACGGDDNDDNGGGGGGGGPDAQNWQTDFSNTGRYGVTVDSALTIDPGTLAIGTSETTDGSYDGPFSTPEGNNVTPDDWFGAVDPSAADANDDDTDGGPFWDGWTYRNSALSTNLPGTTGSDFHPLQAEIGSSITPASTTDTSGCNTNVGDGNHSGLVYGGQVSVFGTDFPVCVISDGDLDGNLRLSNDHVYVLAETVQVGNGDVESASNPSTVDNFTLTIDQGTQVFGDDDQQSSLVISRGSEIDVNGTAAEPVIFGAVSYDGSSITDDPTDLTERGSWGSLVLSGYGVVNDANADDQLQTEAVPDNVTRWYGGSDNSDSSGSIEYAVVAETGTAFRQDEEVQGITIEAAGSGTTISHVQVINSDDDGLEWFGGAANADHLVIQAATDDSLDQDLGWQGTVQTALVIQGPDAGNRGMETDNNGDDFGATPKTSPVLANVTILGHSGNSGDQSAGALHREGYGGQVFRSVYTDNTSGVAGGAGAFQEGCLDVDSEVDEDLEYGDVLFNCTAGALSGDTD